MSVTLKLSDDDARLIARTLASVHVGMTNAFAFKWADYQRENPEVKRDDSNSTSMLEKERSAIVGSYVRGALSMFGTDPAEILRLSSACKTVVLANERS